MSRIQAMLKGREGFLDFDGVLAQYPWLMNPGQRCILSPDSDGLLCGLFMSHHFDWKIIGYYDGKVLVLPEGTSCYDPDVCFLDMEVYRAGVRSMGHHMLAYRNAAVAPDWNHRYSQCLNPHLVRGYDASVFRLKYPLATIHLLLALISSQREVRLPLSAIAPLLFTDGTFNVLYSYPENVLSWLRYLGIDDDGSPLRTIFMQEHYSVYTLMIAMDAFFRARDLISIPGERGDRLRISTTSGEPFNLNGERGAFLAPDARDRIERFLALLSRSTGWEYRQADWTYGDWSVTRFNKSDFKKQGWRVTIANFKSMLGANPLSWAMTSGDNIEYTVERDSPLP